MENKVIDCVEWCPARDKNIISVANEEFVYII